MADVSEFERSIPDTQPYVEKALSLYETVVRTRQGRVIFIAGDVGSGESEIIESLIQEFPKTQPAPNVIERRFSQGDIQSLLQQLKFDHTQAQDTLGNLLAFGATTIMPFAGPTGVLGQLLQTSAAAFNFAKAHAREPLRRPETPNWFKKNLYEAIKENPIVFLFDNLDEATPLFEWCDLLLELAPAISKLPVLFFVTVKGKEELGEHETDESLLEYMMRRLVNDRKLAEWWCLKPLTQSEIAAWIGLDTAPGLVSKLHGMTGGNPSLVRDAWREWKRQEAVIWNDNANRWVFSPNSDSNNNLAKHLLNGRIVKCLGVGKIDKEDAFYKELIEEREETRELLACAALEGRHFTADVLALALDWDRDELIDFLDDKLIHSEENLNGILSEDGYITIEDENGEQKNLWRYVFVEKSDWEALKKDGLTYEEKLNMSHTLANALHKTYESEERLVAHVLARLYKHIGQKESAQRFQTMASYAMAQKSMHEYALHFVHLNKDDWDEWLCHQTTTYLLKAVEVMLGAYPFYETLKVCEEAYSLACRTQSLYEQAIALFYSSRLHFNLGDYESSYQVILSARKIFNRLNDRGGEAVSLQRLSDIAHARNEYEKAQSYAKDSLAIEREIGDRRGEAVLLQKLSIIAHARSEYEEAQSYAKDSLVIFQEISDRHGEASSLQSLSYIAHARDNCEEAEIYAKDSLVIFQEIGDRQGEAASLYSLANIAHARSEYEEAQNYAKDSLAIEREIGYRRGEAVSLRVIGHLAVIQHHSIDGLLLLVIGGLILNDIGGKASAESAMNDIKVAISILGLTNVQIQELFEQAQTAFQQDGGRDLVAQVLERLPKHAPKQPDEGENPTES